MGFVRFVAGALLGLATLAALGAMAQTGMVLAAIAEAAPLTLGDVTGALTRDLAGFGPTYAALLAAPFLALTAGAAAIARAVPKRRLLFFALAGALAPVITLIAAEAYFGVAPVHGARGPAGLALQAGVGLLAGALAALVSAPRPLKA